MKKGIVMDIDHVNICVMTNQGEFHNIPLRGRNCQIGDEVHFDVSARKLPKFLLAGLSSSVAAAALLFLLVNIWTGTWGGGISNNKQIVAYVTIDINPSIEMGIDSQQIVRQIRGINDDGTRLIQNLALNGQSVDKITEELLVRAEPGYFAKGIDDIVISSTLADPNAAAHINDVALSNQLKTIVTHHIDRTHPKQADQFQVTAFAAPKELRNEAIAVGLSTGKYAIYLTAKNNGLQIPLEDYKKESIYTIAKQNGGSASLIKSQDLTKDYLSKLVQDEIKDKRENNGELKQKPQKSQNPMNSEKPEKPMKSGKSEEPRKSEKLEQTPKPQKPEQLQKPEKSSKLQKLQKSEESLKPQNSEKSEQSQKPEKSPKSRKLEESQQLQKLQKPQAMSFSDYQLKGFARMAHT